MRPITWTIAPVLVLASGTGAAFDGPYAPDLWTLTTDAGGFVKSHTASELVLVGGDTGTGGGAGDTDLTITAVASGRWSFSWEFVGNCGDIGGIASAGFDNSYYLINGTPHFLGSEGYPGGKVEVAISVGDVIGYRVDSTDGLFGPGTLTITNFSAPVPAPSTFALMLAAFGSLCGRRRYDSGDGRC